MAVNIIEGKVINEGMKVGIVCRPLQRVHHVEAARRRAWTALRRHDVPRGGRRPWPGFPARSRSPLVAQRMAQSGKFDAVICLGAVIRGATSHYDVVCNEVSKGIAQVQLATGTPVMMGVRDRRHHRAGHRACGHQGRQQGLRVRHVGAIEMVNVLRQL